MIIKKLDIDKIIEEIKQAGYKQGQLINYEELSSMCKKYGKGLKEVDFAQKILEITYPNYLMCKNRNQRVRILKLQKKILTKEEREEVLEELKEVGYKPGQLINYEELSSMCKKYGRGLREEDFAQDILGITYGNYKNCKNRNQRVRILKLQKKILTKEESEEVLEEIKEAGYKPGQLIDYEELSSMCKKYGRGLKEVDFAQKILGIKYANYLNCKSRGKRVRILNLQKKILTKEEREEIVKEIKEAGYKFRQLIDFEELSSMCKKYGRGLKEVDFAQEILEITEGTFRSSKSRGRKVRILKGGELILTEEERKKVLGEIKEAGYKAGQLIDYEELSSMCEKYGKGLNELDFAQRILGITYSSYMNLKNKGTTAKILKEQEKEVTEKERQEIIKEIKEAGYKQGQLINYEELSSMCKKYGKGLKEVDFAQRLLGITYANYMNCKNQGKNVMIKDGISIEKATEIKSVYVNQSQYYKKNVIDEICEQYNMTIDDFIMYVYQENFYDTDIFRKSLEQNGYLWIGRTRLSVDFTDRNINKIEEIASRIASSVCNKYKIKQNVEDYKQDIIIHIIENMGDLEINLGDTDEFFDIVGKKTRKYCEYTAIYNLKISSRYEGVYKLARRSKSDGFFEVEYSDESINIEEEIEEKIEGEIIDSSEDKMDKCINLLKRYIEGGMSKKEAIEETAKNMNIDSETMLEYMQKYLLERGKVKIIKGRIIPVAPSDPSGEGR